MKVHSSRLTLRGLYPDLKRALDLRCQGEKISMERFVIKTLVKELGPELKTIEILNELSEQISVG